MTYAIWVVLKIKNSFRARNIKLQNVTLKRGKFHEEDDKTREIEPDKINGAVIPAGATGVISSRSHVDAATGTEGTIDLYDNETKICTLYWDCPWASKTSQFAVQDSNNDAGYTVSVGPWNSHGPLGIIDIEVAMSA